MLFESIIKFYLARFLTRSYIQQKMVKLKKILYKIKAAHLIEQLHFMLN